MNKAFAGICALMGLIAGFSSYAAEVRTNIPALRSRAAQEGALVRENVNEEQRAKLRDTNEKYRAEQNALNEKLRVARRELEQAAQADITDEKAIRAKAAALGQIEGDLAILRAKQYKDLRAILPREHTAGSGASAQTNRSGERLESIVRRQAITNTAPRRPVPPVK